jgi:hypothetical protein
MKLGSFLSTWINLTNLHLFWYLMLSMRLKKLFWSDGWFRNSWIWPINGLSSWRWESHSDSSSTYSEISLVN